MNDKEKKLLKECLSKKASQLRAMADELDELAGEVEAYIMKKTTQESPEFWGKADCGWFPTAKTMEDL